MENLSQNPKKRKDSAEQSKERGIDTKMSMKKKLEIAAVAAVAMLLSFHSTSDAKVFDVTEYGAKADGKMSIDQVIIQTAQLTTLR